MGWAWLVVGPLLFLMAAISTVKALTTYYIQLWVFSAVAITGFISAIALLAGRVWARPVLKTLSWVVAIYFVGALPLAFLIAVLA